MSRTITETLTSVCASSYHDIEVIVVDDGSADNSVEHVKEFMQKDKRVRLVFCNAGNVAKARNFAIQQSHGSYILPVDADDLISTDYIEEAVHVLETRPEVKAVGCRAEFIGDRTGEWFMPVFSLSLLARKNMIPITSLYRRADYDLTPGYNEDFPIREDWDFWLSIFANGGEYVKLPFVGLYYRIQENSKRVSDRQKKRELIDQLNKRHSEYFYKYLHGPLHYHRSWSRLLNLFRRETEAGDFAAWTAGEVIFSRRNELRRYRDEERQQTVIIKEFQKPNFIKALVYGLIRSSKAKRSYLHALQLDGFTPAPIAYREIRICGLLRKSYYASEESPCQHTFNDILNDPDIPNRQDIIRSVALFTARMHKKGLYHDDFSAGNILFSDTLVQVIDLNRMHSVKHISQRQGCKQFERLPLKPEELDILATAYAEAMNFDIEKSKQLVRQLRWWKHKRIKN